MGSGPAFFRRVGTPCPTAWHEKWTQGSQMHQESWERVMDDEIFDRAQSLAAELITEYERLESLLAAVEWRAEQRHFASAREHYREYLDGLEAYLRLQEEGPH